MSDLRRFVLYSMVPVARCHLASFLSVLFVITTAAEARTITVTTVDDELNNDGDCSLREAVEAANRDSPSDLCPAGAGADTIVLAAATYTIVLPGNDELNRLGDYDIEADVEIVGAGAGSTIIDGARKDRVFDVRRAVVVRLASLTITNGEPNWLHQGGGIHNSGGALTLDAVTLADNHGRRGEDGDGVSSLPDAGGSGGAIASQGGSIVIHDCLFQGNRSGNGGDLTTSRHSMFAGTGGDGGAISGVNTTVTIERSTFVDNSSGTGGAGVGESIPGHGGSGGAMSVYGSVVVRDSVFERNQPGPVGQGAWELVASPGSGGAIVVNRATGLASTELVVERTTFRDNGLLTLPVGGIDASVDLLSVRSSLFERNHGAGVIALRVNGVGTEHRVTNCTFSGNDGLFGWNHYTVSSGDGLDVSHCTFHGSTTHDLQSSSLLRVRSSVVNSCSGSVVSDGFNVMTIGGGCAATAVGDQLVVAAGLGPLADHGGATWTHALLPLSPAIDGGVCSDLDGNPVTEDQRGQQRPQGATCDVGAFEGCGLATIGTVGNDLFATRSSDDVLLGWPDAVVFPDEYNVHGTPTASQLLDSILSQTTPLTAVLGATATDADAISQRPSLFFYKIYPRDCGGMSIP